MSMLSGPCHINPILVSLVIDTTGNEKEVTITMQDEMRDMGAISINMRRDIKSISTVALHGLVFRNYRRMGCMLEGQKLQPPCATRKREKLWRKQTEQSRTKSIMRFRTGQSFCAVIIECLLKGREAIEPQFYF